MDEYEIRIVSDSLEIGFNWEARRAGLGGLVFARGWDETKKVARLSARRACADRSAVDSTPWTKYKP